MDEDKLKELGPPCATIDGVMYWHIGEEPESPNAVEVVCPACEQTFRTVVKKVLMFPEGD